MTVAPLITKSKRNSRFGCYSSAAISFAVVYFYVTNKPYGVNRCVEQSEYDVKHKHNFPPPVLGSRQKTVTADMPSNIS